MPNLGAMSVRGPVSDFPKVSRPYAADHAVWHRCDQVRGALLRMKHPLTNYTLLLGL